MNTFVGNIVGNIINILMLLFTPGEFLIFLERCADKHSGAMQENRKK